MFIGYRIALYCLDMYPTLMGKSRPADIRLVFIMGQIGQFIDKTCCFMQFCKILSRLETAVHLQSQGRDDRSQVGITAPLAKTIHGSLDMGNSQ